jgi:hypothetical protein
MIETTVWFKIETSLLGTEDWVTYGNNTADAAV